MRPARAVCRWRSPWPAAPSGVLTLSDPGAAALGVRLSGPDPARIQSALTEAMATLGDGLTLRPHRSVPLAQAAEVHAGLEDGSLRTKILLAV